MSWRQWLLAVASLVLGGCATSDAGGPAPATGKACKAHSECAAAEVCVGVASNGHCGAELPRAYRIVLEKATDFNSFGDDGKPWDADGSGPDPYAVLTQAKPGSAEAQVCKTTVVNSSDAPMWKLSCTTTLAAGSDLTFSVWDEDGETDANMLQVTLTATELLDIVRNHGGLGQAKATARLWFQIEAL